MGDRGAQQVCGSGLGHCSRSRSVDGSQPAEQLHRPRVHNGTTGGEPLQPVQVDIFFPQHGLGAPGPLVGAVVQNRAEAGELGLGPRHNRVGSLAGFGEPLWLLRFWEHEPVEEVVAKVREVVDLRSAAEDSSP
jgi:hypothetical protein